MLEAKHRIYDEFGTWNQTGMKGIIARGRCVERSYSACVFALFQYHLSLKQGSNIRFKFNLTYGI